MSSISVVVISCGKIERLKVCINSIKKVLTPDDELIIVDNSVTQKGIADDVIRNYLNDVGRNGDGIPIRLKFHDNNLLFTLGANAGIEMCKSPYIFLVNNDIEIINPNTFKMLCEASMSNPKAATVTPVTVQSNGSIYCAGAFGAGAHNRSMPDKIRETEWNNFAFVCLRKDLIEKHGMLYAGNWNIRGQELSCIHWHSDEEYCRRLTALGYKHLVYPITVKHFHME
jgi:GT2 family glycosyltransferase